MPRGPFATGPLGGACRQSIDKITCFYSNVFTAHLKIQNTACSLSEVALIRVADPSPPPLKSYSWMHELSPPINYLFPFNESTIDAGTRSAHPGVDPCFDSSGQRELWAARCGDGVTYQRRDRQVAAAAGTA